MSFVSKLREAETIISRLSGENRDLVGEAREAQERLRLSNAHNN